MEKYKELFDLSREILNEEQNRFNIIDDKASKYLTVLTFLVGLFGFFGNWIIRDLIPPKTVLEVLLILLSFLIFVFLLSSWLITLSVLRVHSLLKIPLNNEMIKFFDDNELIDIYYSLSKGNKKALEKNIKITDGKTRQLFKTYKTIKISWVLLVVFMILFVLHKWGGI